MLGLAYFHKSDHCWSNDDLCKLRGLTFITYVHSRLSLVCHGQIHRLENFLTLLFSKCNECIYARQDKVRILSVHCIKCLSTSKNWVRVIHYWRERAAGTH